VLELFSVSKSAEESWAFNRSIASGVPIWAPLVGDSPKWGGSGFFGANLRKVLHFTDEKSSSSFPLRKNKKKAKQIRIAVVVVAKIGRIQGELMKNCEVMPSSPMIYGSESMIV
tara:strand:- start:142 stop:483 length:342 start_codon:yes stop_codon:yes gene_type:complete